MEINTHSISIDGLLNQVDYKDDEYYVPSAFALQFVNFIKLVNGNEGEEHLTPVLHYKVLDKIDNEDKSIANMLFRGASKTTVMAEYMFLYLATYGELPKFGTVDLAMYVSDSVDNGVKNMRRNLEYRWENSEFLQKYVPKAVFTDVRWEFCNLANKVLVVKGYGAQSGVRGAKELGKRPQLAVLDDLISDSDARSNTVISSIEDTVYKAIEHALHPQKRKIIWSGTPFNSKDPLYKAIESGAWVSNVFPVCERFPCEKSEFRSAWPDRFTYEVVLDMYTKALKAGKVDTFNQEMMLRIMSAEERLIQDCDISWYKRSSVLNNKELFNFYITTDFATTGNKGDFSVISVWAYNNNGDWLWVDGIVKKQDMSLNVNDLFRLVQMYRPQEVGIEITGQQKGFVSWIQDQMLVRNVYFTLTKEKGANTPGIRPNTNKAQRFDVMVPLFKMNKIFFPEERRGSPEIMEAIEELSLISAGGFKAKHDDFIDTISMLASINAWKPSMTGDLSRKDEKDYWEIEEEVYENGLSSYIV